MQPHEGSSDRQAEFRRSDELHAISSAASLPGASAAQVLALREGINANPLLLSTRGVLQVFRELSGLESSVDDVVDAATFHRFVGDIRGYKDGLLQGALYYAMEGALALQQGAAPQVRSSKYSDPILGYLGALEVLSARLADPAEFGRRREYHAAQFHSMRWTEAWNSAIEAARNWESKLREPLLTESDTPRARPGQDSDVMLSMVDDTRHVVGSFTTFYLRNSERISENDALLRRLIPVNELAVRYGVGRKGISDRNNTFASALLSELEYPDQSIPLSAEVETVVGVVPLDPQTQRVQFKLIMKTPDGPSSIEVLTPQGWATETELLYSRKGQRLRFGRPHSIGGTADDLFSATGTSASAPDPAAVATALGADASNGIVVVLKETIRPERASFLREILGIKTGRRTAESVASGLNGNPYRNELVEELVHLAAAGHISAGDADTIKQWCATLPPPRGAIPAELRSEEGLETNPLRPPRIVVIYPCGISDGSTAQGAAGSPAS